MPFTKVSITTEQVTAKVLELAEEFPEAKYSPDHDNIDTGGRSYSYVEGQAGEGFGCIFGQALKSLGVDADILREFEEHRSSIGIIYLAKYLGIDPDPEWEEVQGSQDLGIAWEQATKILRNQQP